MNPGLTPQQRVTKRAFDIVVAGVGLVLLWPVILAAAVIARIETGEPAIFRQVRVGRYGRHFEVLKIRTMRSDPSLDSTVTVDDDPRITRCGRVLRRTKIDELPQLLNVLRGDMSIVGPRPDVPGFHDRLEGDDRIVLSVRPGITGLAAIRFRDEERLLAAQAHPERFNRDVLFPAKVALDRAYATSYSPWVDVRIIVGTLLRCVYGDADNVGPATTDPGTR